MKINDQGFTERISSQASPTTGIGGDSGRRSSSTGSAQTSADNLQLSSLASILQTSRSLDSQRSGKLSEIASAVRSNTFQFNAAQISSALVSEAAQGSSR